MLKKIMLLLSIAALSACNATLPVAQTKKEEKPYVHISREYVSISCVTHGTGYIYSFFVEEPVYSGIISITNFLASLTISTAIGRKN